MLKLEDIRAGNTRSKIDANFTRIKEFIDKHCISLDPEVGRPNEMWTDLVLVNASAGSGAYQDSGGGGGGGDEGDGGGYVGDVILSPPRISGVDVTRTAFEVVTPYDIKAPVVLLERPAVFVPDDPDTEEEVFQFGVIPAWEATGGGGVISLLLSVLDDVDKRQVILSCGAGSLFLEGGVLCHEGFDEVLVDSWEELSGEVAIVPGWVYEVELHTGLFNVVTRFGVGFEEPNEVNGLDEIFIFDGLEGFISRLSLTDLADPSNSRYYELNDNLTMVDEVGGVNGLWEGSPILGEAFLPPKE